MQSSVVQRELKVSISIPPNMCSIVRNFVKYTTSWTSFWVGIFGDADKETRGHGRQAAVASLLL
jgi:hypothetical protein